MKTKEKESIKQLEHLFSIFTRPTITHHLSEEPMPSDIRNATIVSKLVKVAQDDYRTATDEEAMWYLSTTSLVVPLLGDWFNIYMYLFKKWAKIDNRSADFIDENTHNSLQNHEEQMLMRLKDWIYKEQNDAMKERRKLTRGEVLENIEKGTKKDIKEEQQNLIDYVK